MSDDACGHPQEIPACRLLLWPPPEAVSELRASELSPAQPGWNWTVTSLGATFSLRGASCSFAGAEVRGGAEPTPVRSVSSVLSTTRKSPHGPSSLEKLSGLLNSASPPRNVPEAGDGLMNLSAHVCPCEAAPRVLHHSAAQACWARIPCGRSGIRNAWFSDRMGPRSQDWLFLI